MRSCYDNGHVRISSLFMMIHILQTSYFLCLSCFVAGSTLWLENKHMWKTCRRTIKAYYNISGSMHLICDANPFLKVIFFNWDEEKNWSWKLIVNAMMLCWFFMVIFHPYLVSPIGVCEITNCLNFGLLLLSQFTLLLPFDVKIVSSKQCITPL